MDKLAFQEACDKVASTKRERNSIGTLSEKTTHAVLKFYYEPYSQNHEIKLSNFVADIVGKQGIIEIQTASFGAMSKKLAAFLEVTSVTIVYPIIRNKWICWVDNETQVVIKKRKSPKNCVPFSIFFELYRIRALLKNPNLSFVLPVIDVNELRFTADRTKSNRKSVIYSDKIPIELVDELQIRSLDDYCELLPNGLPSPFTVKELSKLAGVLPNVAQAATSVLRELGIIKLVGKQNQINLYEKEGNLNYDRK